TLPIDTQTFTLGLTANLSARFSNEFRANYSNQRSSATSRLDSFGGAVPPADSALFPSGLSSKDGSVGILIGFLPGSPEWTVGRVATVEQRQLNFVDNFSVSVRTHQMRYGVDYRWLAPFQSPFDYFQDDIFGSMASVLSGTVDLALTK